MCDADKDQLLDDNELNDFQRRCFGNPLSSQEIEGIKELVVSAGPAASATAQWPRQRKQRLSVSKSAASSSSSGSANGRADSGLHGAGSRHTDIAMSHPNLYDNKLTVSGWLHLHTLFIQRGQLETTWAVLQSYGYNRDLALESDYLYPPTFHVPSDCAVELSPYGYSFLTDVFEVHDHDQDGSLCEEELNELFATAPGGKHPWQGTGFPTNTTATNENGAVTLQGWLAQWSMTTLLDYKVTLAYLAYLGYPNFAIADSVGESSSSTDASSAKQNGVAASKRSRRREANRPSPPPTTSALKLTQRNTRRLFSSGWSSPFASSTSGSSTSTKDAGSSSASAKKKRKKKGDPTDRSVFLAYVIGPPASGKSSLLDAMLGKRVDSRYVPTSRPRSVVCAVEPHAVSDETTAGLVLSSNGGYERYLVLQEYPAVGASHTPSASASNLAASSTSLAATGSGVADGASGSQSKPGVSASLSGLSISGAEHDLPADASAFLNQASKSSALADVVIFLFDSSDTSSFSYISNVRQKYAATLGSLPTLVVANKADLDEAQQRHEVQPDVYCRKLGIERFSPWKLSLVAGADHTSGAAQHIVGSRSIDIDSYEGPGGLASPVSPYPYSRQGALGAGAGDSSLNNVGDLVAVACAIAQDPNGNGAVPGAKGRGQGGAGWFHGLLSVFGLQSSKGSTEDAEEDISTAASNKKSGNNLGVTKSSTRRSTAMRRSSHPVTEALWLLGGVSAGVTASYCCYHWYRHRTLPNLFATAAAGCARVKGTVWQTAGQGVPAQPSGDARSDHLPWFGWLKGKVEL